MQYIQEAYLIQLNKLGDLLRLHNTDPVSGTHGHFVAAVIIGFHGLAFALSATGNLYNDLIFRGNLDETEVGRVHEGMPVKLTIGALQDLSFNATLEYISPKGVEENGANQFEIKAAIQAPDSVQIRSGYSANAEIVLERALKTLALPESTVEFSGDSTFVYVMTDSVPVQKFERRPIQVGMSDGIKIAIKSGISAQDKIRGTEKKD